MQAEQIVAVAAGLETGPRGQGAWHGRSAGRVPAARACHPEQGAVSRWGQAMGTSADNAECEDTGPDTGHQADRRPQGARGAR